MDVGEERDVSSQGWSWLPLVVLGGLAASFGLLFGAQFIVADQFKWLKLLLESIASTILVAATVGTIVQQLTHKQIIHALNKTTATISQEVRTLRALEALGLVDAHSDVNSYSFGEMILSSNEFTAVMNDGKSWVGRNAGSLRKRLLLPNLRTTLILQHPNSEMIEILAKKVEQTPDFVRWKIWDTVRELNSFPKHDSHQLSIAGHRYFNVHSLFMNEELIAHTPYLITPGRNTTPVFLFARRGQSSQYERWRNDIDQLMKASEPLAAPAGQLEGLPHRPEPHVPSAAEVQIV